MYTTDHVANVPAELLGNLIERMVRYLEDMLQDARDHCVFVGTEFDQNLSDRHRVLEKRHSFHQVKMSVAVGAFGIGKSFGYALPAERRQG